MISFIAPKQPVVEVLKHMKAGVKNTSKDSRRIFCEITITQGNVKFAGNGYAHNLKCKTKGVAKFTLPMFYLEDVVKKHKGSMLEFEVEPEWITLGAVNFHANVSLLEDDSILRTIDLPKNYTDKELLQLPDKGYTIEELDFNKITPRINAAQIRLETNIEKAFNLLSVYGVKEDEIEKMVYTKLKIKNTSKVL